MTEQENEELDALLAELELAAGDEVRESYRSGPSADYDRLHARVQRATQAIRDWIGKNCVTRGDFPLSSAYCED